MRRWIRRRVNPCWREARAWERGGRKENAKGGELRQGVMKRALSPKRFLTEQESQQVAEAIRHVENRTSAEIKVITLRHCWMDIHEKAVRLFKKLRLDRTRDRNCVLILLVLTNREFALLGDKGIHEKVGQGFWEETRDILSQEFRADQFGEGLQKGILRIGEKLAEHFPGKRRGSNEIADEIHHEE